MGLGSHLNYYPRLGSRADVDETGISSDKELLRLGSRLSETGISLKNKLKTKTKEKEQHSYRLINMCLAVARKAIAICPMSLILESKYKHV